MVDTSQLSDDDLDFALFHHVLHRIDNPTAGPDERHTAVMALPDDLRAVFTTMLVEMEVANGGFHQYFWNTSGRYAEAALAGYERLGAVQHAAILREATELFAGEQAQQQATELFAGEQAQQQAFQATRNLQGFVDSAKESRLNELNLRFYQANDDEEIVARRAAYARAHPATCELDALEPCHADLLQCPLNRRGG